MADESGTDVVYSATERQQYRRDYYQANRAEILAYEKERQARIKADPVRLAREREQNKLRARRIRAAVRAKGKADKLADPVAMAHATAVLERRNEEARLRSRKRYADPAKRHDQKTRDANSRRAHPERWLVRSAKARAKEKGLAFDLVATDVVVPSTCPICDIPLCIAEGRWAGNSPTLDRVDPETGYVKTNVRVICFNCNAVKSNGSAELHEKIAAYMRGHNG